MKHLNEQQHALWQRIQSFNLDAPNVNLPFSARLARENAWTTDFAVRSIQEYKKFCFLLCLSNEPLTPCDAVDQVWHLHLIYTQNYWVDWCTNILNKNIHHHPTQGGTVKGINSKIGTKELYLSINKPLNKFLPPIFGCPLSSDLRRYNFGELICSNIG